MIITALEIPREKFDEIREMIRANCGIDRKVWKFIDDPKMTFEVIINGVSMPVIVREKKAA